MIPDSIPRPESIPGGERVPQLVAAYERARTAYDLYMAAYLEVRVRGVPKDAAKPIPVRTEGDVFHEEDIKAMMRGLGE